jgi:F0F1-type ATP synthase delta subunit
LVENEKYNFEQNSVSKINDSVDKIKYLLKKFEKFYSFLIWLVSPVLSTNYFKKFLKTYLQHMNKEPVIVNLGSGNSNISEFANCG